MIREVFNSPAERAEAMERRHMMIMYDDGVSPEELASMHAQHERHERNLAWLLPRLPAIYAEHKGKCICVAGQELFVADAPLEVIASAKAAHPDDDGRILRYLSPDKEPRIYAR